MSNRISLIESLAARGRGTSLLGNRTSPAAAPRNAPIAAGRILPAHVPSDFVKTIVAGQDNDVERARLGGEYVHVSALIGLCQRQFLLAGRQEQALLRAVTGGHRVMWAIGRAVERHVREQVIAGARPMVFGKWVCPCGTARHTGHFPQHRCGQCGQPLGHYEEYTQTSEDAKVIGNPDLLLRFRERLLVTEIKSMNSKDFEALKDPKGDHIFQAMMYRRMLADNGHPVHDVAAIFYVTKDFKWGSPYKEFHIDMMTPLRVSEADQALELARALRRHREAGTLPSRVCGSATESRAKACPLVGMCFNLSA